MASGAASAVALRALAARPGAAAALVSLSGRLDLAPHARLARVRVPTLLVVGAYDAPLLDFNRLAAGALPAAELRVVARTDRHAGDAVAVEVAARAIHRWLDRRLRPAAARAPLGEAGPRATRDRAA